MGPAADSTNRCFEGVEMRYFAMFLMILSLGLFTVGCTESTDAPAETPSPVESVDEDAGAGAEEDATEEGAAEEGAAEGDAEKATE